MNDFNYIPAIALLVCALLSVGHKPYALGASVVAVIVALSLYIDNMVISQYEQGSLAGGFLVFTLSALISLIFLKLYDIEKVKLLSKLGLTFLLFSTLHLLYIMTYIPVIRSSSWYYAPVFDQMYWQYENLQFILTFYMISLFWKSGMGQLKNGVIRIFRFIRPRKIIPTIHGKRLGNSSPICIMGPKDKNYNKGI